MPKPVGEKREEGWSIGYQDDTHMGATGAQGLESGIFGWEVEDSMQYEDIRTNNQYEVHSSCKEGNNEAVGSANSCLSTGNLDEGHELTVGVGNDIGSAVGKPT